ncbi:MAG: glycosyltransferase family 2 protein [Planctomycetes bacterium]|nr:glycosyltransferase family 2 protein [Planctomycetota bacterium]
MPEPRLSLVVVNWNTRELLLQLLARLSEGAPFHHEILVVDNDSGDGSIEAVQRDFPSVIALPQPKNGGFAYGVNRGLERATGAWILLLNTDTEVRWEEIERFLDAAERAPEAAVFGPRIVDELRREQISTWTRHRPRDYLPQALFLDRMFATGFPAATETEVDCVSGCVFLIRRSVLAKVGGFDERFFMYFEEADFCERVRRSGAQVHFVPEASFVHVGGLSAAGAAKRTFLAFRESCLLYHAAWHGRLMTEWVRLCLLLGVTLRLCAWSVLAALGRRNRAGLYGSAFGMLVRPGLVGALCRRPREVPAIGKEPVS